MRSDTSPEAARIQTQVYRRIGGARRLELACQMSEFVHTLAYARIRIKHSDLDDLGVRRQLIWELYGIRFEPE